MKQRLVALKLDVGLHDNGHAKYPDFNKISSVTRKGMDWSKYIDVHGSGMHYDKCCGHKDDGDTPYGHQCCCVCVPEDFAAEALILFPGTVTVITEAEFEAFHDKKAHAHEPGEHLDANALNGLQARRSLMVSLGQSTEALDAQIAKALDPLDHEAGVKANLNKTWKEVVKKQGITIA